MTLKQARFELGLLISHDFLFQVFNAADNLKATRASHWFFGLNENVTDLKSDGKNLFWHVFEKMFCYQVHSQWECGVALFIPDAGKSHIKD